VGVTAELLDAFLHVTCQIRNGGRALNNRGVAVAAVVDGDDAEDIGKRIELRQPHINCGANRPDEHQGALWSLRLAWSVFNKVQLCHVFLAFLFYNCCHARSEEHTSELQSRFDLVCRLLLEKKKKVKMELYLIIHTTFTL